MRLKQLIAKRAARDEVLPQHRVADLSTVTCVDRIIRHVSLSGKITLVEVEAAIVRPLYSFAT